MGPELCLLFLNKNKANIYFFPFMSCYSYFMFMLHKIYGHEQLTVQQKSLKGDSSCSNLGVTPDFIQWGESVTIST
jgi:hypothetical protein